MKTKSLIAICVIVALGGCSVEFMPFHSTADIPYYQKTKRTEIVYISGDEEIAKSREYGVFACKDSVENYYLLIAPKPTSTSFREHPHKKFAIYNSALLKPGHVRELHRVCGVAIATWNDEIPPGEALYYEYMSAPEQKIIQVSENVVEWRPSLRFWYQHGGDGPVGHWIIGEGLNKCTHDFEDLAYIKDLSNLLSLGFKELRKFGYSD